MASAKEIAVNTLKENGILEAEKGIVDAIAIIKKVLIALESADETVVKSLAPVALMVFSSFESKLKEMADLNHDNKIG